MISSNQIATSDLEQAGPLSSVIFAVNESREPKDPGSIPYIVASESVALDVVRYRRLRDVRPGEGIFIENSGVFHSREYSGNARYTPCIFEFVYLARPESILDNLSVHKARLRMGEQLAGQIVPTLMAIGGGTGVGGHRR